MNKKSIGSFTLPGEAGYEDLTLELADKWGADVIRDSDGTALSENITSADFDIYSTLCIIREDNQWAKNNKDKLQQNFLMTDPVVALDNQLKINLLDGYFEQQFEVNYNDHPKKWWQVYDRTLDQEVTADNWSYNQEKNTVTIKYSIKGHKYTVNFLAYRIWEAISMYNHITNDWGDREHLMPVDPIYPETQKHLLEYLEKWLQEHPQTDVVRFTSMFYNFCWFWGDDPNLRFRYSDWGSYDFTVSPYALKKFEEEKGYQLQSEDFVNQGYYNSTHNVPNEKYQEWMDFVNQFVVDFGSQLIDLVHKYDKKAYVFYDDHWIGIEPYGKRFKEFGFDGLIKCVFNAFEARKCAGVEEVDVHELRLHPYLFPTGLTGEPTFKEGGDPTLDTKKYWMNVRRAFLRAKIDRIGLGGYLHLVEKFPDFVEYMEELSQEFREIKKLHEEDKAETAPYTVAVLSSWGDLRSWICCGHLHENPELSLNHILEALAGLPFEVKFISFDDILENGIEEDIKVIINAGKLDSAWSGGNHWKNSEIVTTITNWAADGGGFIGVAEPSATKFSSQYFQLSHLLGVDREIGLTTSQNKYNYTRKDDHFITKDLNDINNLNLGKITDNIYALDSETEVLAADKETIQLAAREFEKGRGVYLTSFKHSISNNRLLHRIIAWAAGETESFKNWLSSNPSLETAYFPKKKKLLVINNSSQHQEAIINCSNTENIEVEIAAYQSKIINLDNGGGVIE